MVADGQKGPQTLTSDHARPCVGYTFHIGEMKGKRNLNSKKGRSPTKHHVIETAVKEVRQGGSRSPRQKGSILNVLLVGLGGHGHKLGMHVYQT